MKFITVAFLFIVVGCLAAATVALGIWFGLDSPLQWILLSIPAIFVSLLAGYLYLSLDEEYRKQERELNFNRNIGRLKGLRSQLTDPRNWKSRIEDSNWIKNTLAELRILKTKLGNLSDFVENYSDIKEFVERYGDTRDKKMLLNETRETRERTPSL